MMRRSLLQLLVSHIAAGCSLLGIAAGETYRFATFNVALHRPTAEGLPRDLRGGGSEQARKVAAILQTIRPDVVLLNEFDYQDDLSALQVFRSEYLEVSQHNLAPLNYTYTVAFPVNTGLPSQLDLNQDGSSTGPEDAWGYGQFPGQYGLVVLSRWPIDVRQVRSFQKFRWSDQPGACRPLTPEGSSFYPEHVWRQLRLSSKNHLDIPIQVGSQTIHFLVAHPTPPVFDGPEDRNGCRNHDEIRFWRDYVEPARAGYIYDDNGRAGGLATDALFLVAGDLNADPCDGDSRAQAIGQLLDHSRIQDPLPASWGGEGASSAQKRANLDHRGAPHFDTADFSDATTGNLRVDYVLPSEQFSVRRAGIFWPSETDRHHAWIDASDHRLVWVDVAPPPPANQPSPDP